jgi:hypothetical protein
MRGIIDRVVKDVNFKPHTPHHCEFECRQGLWILSCEQAISLQNVGGSTQVPFVPKIMHERAPDDFQNDMVKHTFKSLHLAGALCPGLNNMTSPLTSNGVGIL